VISNFAMLKRVLHFVAASSSLGLGTFTFPIL
jgi:hypothetical protein